MSASPLNATVLLWVLGGVVFGIALAFAWRWWRLRRVQRRLVQSVTSTGFEHVRNVLVPDGNGSTLHIDFLVLTPRGVLVVDLRDVTGNVFGGDQMTDWTVMNGPMRSTFRNPQGALYDRVAAVRAIVGEVPVEGRIVFTRNAKFPKGLPKWTLPIEALRADFPAADRNMFESVLARFRSGWSSLKQQATPSPLGNPRPL